MTCENAQVPDHALRTESTQKFFASKVHVKMPHVELQRSVTEIVFEIHVKSTLCLFQFSVEKLWL